ncbi:hypothetical protein SDJN02_02790 [Cucurbita argyrosperma subsp. argyrosperma]|nr:hypothetical protein SDJN02_02790 [Cucurbita argyrosperma subsp. argyrosperma]
MLSVLSWFFILSTPKFPSSSLQFVCKYTKSFTLLDVLFCTESFVGLLIIHVDKFRAESTSSTVCLSPNPRRLSQKGDSKTILNVARRPWTVWNRGKELGFVWT